MGGWVFNNLGIESQVSLLSHDEQIIGLVKFCHTNVYLFHLEKQKLEIGVCTLVLFILYVNAATHSKFEMGKLYFCLVPLG